MLCIAATLSAFNKRLGSSQGLNGLTVLGNSFLAFVRIRLRRGIKGLVRQIGRLTKDKRSGDIKSLAGPEPGRPTGQYSLDTVMAIAV